MFAGVDKLQRGLDAAWLRNDTILNNIANADTPGFNRSSVEFEDYFKAELQKGENDFVHKQTREGHRGIGGGQEPAVAQVVTDTSSTMRMDGNNVDPDKEMSDLAKNIIYYNTLANKVSGELGLLRTTIKEVR